MRDLFVGGAARFGAVFGQVLPSVADIGAALFARQIFTHQAMPLHGYTRMFERMLDHPNIDLDHCYGKLPYRSLQFRHETHDVARFQPVGVVNYPVEEVPYTRITEYKRLTGQQSPRTSITYEIPSVEGDPYYPIPRPENQALFKRYEALAIAQANVNFVGRLATSRYYNMDQVVGQALSAYRRLAVRLTTDEPAFADAPRGAAPKTTRAVSG